MNSRHVLLEVVTFSKRVSTHAACVRLDLEMHNPMVRIEVRALLEGSGAMRAGEAVDLLAALLGDPLSRRRRGLLQLSGRLCDRQFCANSGDCRDGTRDRYRGRVVLWLGMVLRGMI